MRKVLVSRLWANNSSKTKVHQISSHETQRVSERIRCKIIDFLLIQRRDGRAIDINDWFELPHAL